MTPTFATACEAAIVLAVIAALCFCASPFLSLACCWIEWLFRSDDADQA